MTKIKNIVMLALVSGHAMAAELPSYQNPQSLLEQRVEDLLGRLTLEEKIGLLHGSFEVGGIQRLNIPPLSQSDGPVGVRNPTATTALPCTLSLSCTWDVNAAQAYGRLLGEEMLALHKNVLFGPGIDLMRDPCGGRNFEYMGEDPLLTGSLSVSYILGVQTNGVAACAKHLVANDCEHRRFFTSSNMGDRTLREMSLLPFEMAVRDGHVWTMMSGNNLFNGLYCAENRRLQQEIIKDELGFDGAMLTDWRAAYDPVSTALAGTEMTLGQCAYVYGDGRLLEAVKSRQVPVSSIDDKTRRVLRLYLRTGVIDPATRSPGALDTPEHREQARRLATEGMVLLKNEHRILPLDVSQLKTVLVTGPAADMVPLGHGSGFVNSAVRITPLAGIQSALGSHTTIKVMPWEKSGDMTNQPVTQQKQKDAVFQAVKDIGRAPDAEALKSAARGASLVLFFATDVPHGEQEDLDDINLPAGQDAAIQALAKVNTNIVVVLLTGQPVLLESWADKVPAILEGWYAGESTGDAVADVLTGKASPGGRLSCTFGKRLEDYPSHALGVWPARLIVDADPGNGAYKPKNRKPIYAFAADYKEGVFSGYRWFDDKQIEPRYPFGYGLSYSTFALSDLVLDSSHDSIKVTCAVKNTGTREDAEVVQVYVAPPKSSVPRPPRELKGFAKVRLKPGESRKVEVFLRPTALAFYDEVGKNWKTEVGEYQIEVGTSSRDIFLKSGVTLKTGRTHAKF